MDDDPQAYFRQANRRTMTQIRLQGGPPGPAPSSDVPCGSCTRCCKGQVVGIAEEYGDNPADYLTTMMDDPLTGGQVLALKHRENGDCIYLVDERCTIYAHRPAVCRTFDCRILYWNLMQESKKAAKLVARIDPVIAAGRAKLHTLK